MCFEQLVSSRLKWDTLITKYSSQSVVSFRFVSFHFIAFAVVVVVEFFLLRFLFHFGHIPYSVLILTFRQSRCLLFDIVQIAVDVMGFHFESIYSPTVPTITELQAEKRKSDRKKDHSYSCYRLLSLWKKYNNIRIVLLVFLYLSLQQRQQKRLFFRT